MTSSKLAELNFQGPTFDNRLYPCRLPAVSAKSQVTTTDVQQKDKEVGARVSINSGSDRGVAEM